MGRERHDSFDDLGSRWQSINLEVGREVLARQQSMVELILFFQTRTFTPSSSTPHPMSIFALLTIVCK